MTEHASAEPVDDGGQIYEPARHRDVGDVHRPDLVRTIDLQPAPGHKIYPYLLRGLKVDCPNQVCAMDITYIPMARGFVYLAAVVDWFSRRVLSHRVSITMEAGFCVEALEEALAKHGRPKMFNTDQGSQLTSFDFTGVPIALVKPKTRVSAMQH